MRTLTRGGLSGIEGLGCFGQVLGLLQQHQHLVLDENFDSGLVERTEEPSAEEGDVHVWGSLVAFVERLDDELFKSLQVRACSPSRLNVKHCISSFFHAFK